MWQRAYRNLVVLLLIFPATIFAQQEVPHYAPYSPHILKFSTKNDYSPGYKVQKAVILSNYYGSFEKLNFHITPTIAPDFYCRHLGFVCKKELQLEKATSIPFRLRLGSLEYVDRLEGKK